MKKQDRSDRIIIAAALLILLIAGGLFHFDEWMWGARRQRGERIGVIVERKGDVRLKYEGDLKWSRAAGGQDLVYNDAVYAGANSRAELQVGESSLSLTENSLIVLRRDMDINFLNLHYGTLFGKLAKNETVMIDVGDGKPIRLSAGKETQVVLRRTDGKSRLDVTAGKAEVTIDGVKRTLDQSASLVLGDKTPAELLRNHLRIVRPTHLETIVSEDSARIEFQWAWENGRAARPDERYTLEFSADPGFKKIHNVKRVQGALTTSMSVSQSLSLHYRVRSGDEVSPPEQVNFVRLERPLIMSPQAGQRIETPKNTPAPVTIEFKRPDAASVWYQIASDSEFKQILLNQNTTDLKQIQQLPTGDYFLRARADFGGGRLTRWTPAVNFQVAPEMEILPLAKMTLPKRILIPNRAYPRRLYTAPGSEVSGFLAERGFMRGFFPFKPGEIDELHVQIESGVPKSYVQADSAWPVDRLYPARHQYRYQAVKSGLKPSAWTDARKLDIAMEPPRPLGDASYGDANAEGEREADWRITPLLFARSYDIEVSPTPGFAQPLELRSDEPRVRARLPQGEYYWRARARDDQGRIISAFSPAYKLKEMPVAPAPILARNEPAPPPIRREVRKPAQASESLRSRVNRVREKPWQSSGWWAWLGAGENYVDYRQSIPGRGTLDAQNVKGPSQYFEGGYTGSHGVGGLISYKNTPGEFKFEDAEVFPNTFQWTTISLEGIVKKPSPFSLWNYPVVYGMRAGIQQHRIPFLFLPAEAEYLELKNNQMSSASFGLLAEMARRRWTYYWTMRYQFPLSSRADGANEFAMNPVFAFDGSLGMAYNFTQRMKIGMFWYGQWHQFNFVYGDEFVTNTGFQSLFYSNLDIRFGLEF